MIRHAVHTDFPLIESVREPYLLAIDRLEDLQYRWKMQKSGFIGRLTGIEFEKDLHHLFLVDEDDLGITGYLRIDRDHEYQDNDKKIWLDDGDKKTYFEGHHAEIGMIGVRVDMKGKGVGQRLLDDAIRQLKEKEISYLFSIVVISPLTNFPSMMFHERQGFTRVAVSRPHHHFEMDNYQSVLYRKPL